jgi:hypothetical protein
VQIASILHPLHPLSLDRVHRVQEVTREQGKAIHRRAPQSLLGGTVADLVVIEFLGEALALTRQELEGARMRAQALLPPPAASNVAESPERLVDAEALAGLTSLPQSWLEEQARGGAIPSLQLGKYRRFQVAETLAAIRKLGRGR